MPTKHIHRIPVAEEFIEPIGEALCVCQYLDFTLRCIGRKLEPAFYKKTLNLPSGPVREELEKLLKKIDGKTSLRLELLALCENADTIFKQRNKVIHSHGYTTPQGLQSRLSRRKEDSHNTYLNPEGIRKFTEQAAIVACKANELLHDSRMEKDQ